MARQYVYEKNGIKMRYATFGEGSEILVIVPGISVKNVTPLADSIEARYNIPEYAGRFTFYVFDEKEDPGCNVTIRDMSDALATVMCDLGLKNVNMLGISMGGMITLAMAAYHPEFVSRMCLVSTAVTTPDPFKKVLPEWIRLGQEHNAKGLAEHFADYVYSQKTLELYRDSIISGCLDATDTELDNYAIRSTAMLDWDLRNDISRIHAPALVIGSKGDILYGYECALTNGQLLNCETFLFGSEYGHAVYDEAPDFVAKVLEFFAS